MKIRMLKIFSITACAANLALSESGAPNDWTNVVRIAPGTKVEVIHRGLKNLNGVLVHTDGNRITVRAQNSEMVLLRGDITRVTVRAGSRKKHALIGLAIGAGAAAALGGAAKSKDNVTGQQVLAKGAVVAGAVAGGAVAGALVGATLPDSHTVYRVSAEELSTRRQERASQAMDR